jgi:hypothetical protein
MFFKDLLLIFRPKRRHVDFAHLVTFEVSESFAAELFHVPVGWPNNSLFSRESSGLGHYLSAKPLLVSLHGFNTGVHFPKFSLLFLGQQF